MIRKTRRRAEAIAERFHEEYESLAPLYHYKTRAESAVDWDDVPLMNHRELMVHTVANLLAMGVIA